jgi:GNAT superfamily N-acetyltransferase
MNIRVADLADKAEIIALYERSQLATALPNPELIPPAELGQRLYERHAIERFVAIEGGRIAGHAMIEEPNPGHEEAWRQALDDTNGALMEMGAAFVEPALSGRDIWSSLLLHRINLICKAGAHPVTATWNTNEHVKRTFKSYGGIHAGQQTTPLGEVALFVFRLQ